MPERLMVAGKTPAQYSQDSGCHLTHSSPLKDPQVALPSLHSNTDELLPHAGDSTRLLGSGDTLPLTPRCSQTGSKNDRK